MNNDGSEFRGWRGGGREGRFFEGDLNDTINPFWSDVSCSKSIKNMWLKKTKKHQQMKRERMSSCGLAREREHENMDKKTGDLGFHPHPGSPADSRFCSRSRSPTPLCLSCHQFANLCLWVCVLVWQGSCLPAHLSEIRSSSHNLSTVGSKDSLWGTRAAWWQKDNIAAKRSVWDFLWFTVQHLAQYRCWAVYAIQGSLPL